MFLMFARFSFKSSDLVAENKNYLEHHVRLARQLPGVRMYLTGKLAESARGKPNHYRAVVFGYDTPEAGLNSVDCPVGVEMMADSAQHIVGTVVSAFEGEVIVPFDSRRPGQPCCVALVMANLNIGADDPRYLAHRNSMRTLPGLCGYMAGPTFEARGEKPARNWMEIGIFRTPDAMRRAFSAAASGRESPFESALIYNLEGEVQM
jgi:hypothetical protein